MKREKSIDDHLLRLEIEDFLWYEADLLDEHQYDEWLDLFTDDTRYWLPIRRNVSSREMDKEFSEEGADISWMTNDKPGLERRVRQIQTHDHWSEEPFSRVSHIVSNVQVLGWSGPNEVRVKCRFVFYRNRHSDEESTMIGKRTDTLRRVDDGWKIARREIYLDQSVLLHKNLTSFL